MKEKKFHCINKHNSKSRLIFKHTSIIHNPPSKEKKNLQITYEFKQRKIELSSQNSLQNFRQKLNEIYYTCRGFALSRSIFLLAISILKNHWHLSEKLKITATQTMACLTLSIKFEQQMHSKLGLIVKSSKINKCELVGAQLFILQTLSMKLPIINIQQYQLTLQYFTKQWNEHIEQNIKDLPTYFHIDWNAEYNSQPFQNYVNVIVLADMIMLMFMHLTQKLTSLQYLQYLVLGMYFVVCNSASLINYNIDHACILQQFPIKTQTFNPKQIQPNIYCQMLLQKHNEIAQKLNCTSYINNISNTQYKQHWHRTHKNKHSTFV